MNSVILAFAVFAAYIIAYHTYGRFLARKIFRLDPQYPCPSKTLADGYDYVATPKHVLFGHHFTSIAGLGPIVGPAIGVIWGWVPAVIWVLLGSIFFGAVHDFGALVVSVRAQGRSVGDLAGDVINKRVRTLFLIIIFFELWLLIAVFALIMAILFDQYPHSIIPVWFEILIALAVGKLIYSRKMDPLLPSIAAVVLMYVTVVAGAYLPIDMEQLFGLSKSQELVAWIIIVLVLDAWLASSLPVQTLLQPRDFINAHQLMIAMALLVLGMVVSHPVMVGPALETAPKGAPDVWPFLFVVVACGAISGFHCVVSSGTSSKQCASESDALFVGYGSMLWEGALSTLVIVAVAAGIGLGLSGEGGQILTGQAAFQSHYASWAAASGLGSKLGAFVQGSANMIQSLGIPPNVAVAIMAVFIVSFAATSVDTATRLQRYVIVELAREHKMAFLTRRQPATLVAVVTAFILAFHDGSGKGALKLWPLFGTVNQLLAGLALLVCTIYLARRKANALFTAVPMVFMVFITGWAMILNIGQYWQNANWLLLGIGVAVFLLEIWMIVESVDVFKNVYGKKLGLPAQVK